MKLIHTEDGRHYRRWINLLVSLLLPGSAQFLSGRRTAGVAWFGVSLVWGLMIVAYLLHPRSPYSVDSLGSANWLMLPLLLAIAGDGLRRPMRRLHFKGWVLLLGVSLGIPILAVLVIRAYFIQPFTVPTGAMQPTIMGNRQDAAGNQILGDRVLVDKLVYRRSPPRRGDVIVFRTNGIMPAPGKQVSYYVKRLVGLPGETISIDPPYVLANGSRLTEPAIFRKIAAGRSGYGGYCLGLSNATPTARLTLASDSITLGPDEYFVLGDNSRRSLDGRYFGPIKRRAIVGKAFYIYAPTDRKRPID